MKLETFFEKFALFADAPDAVAKMRELVLQLAVQGKLVEQEHEEGNAVQLLAAVSRERDAQAAKWRAPEESASANGNEHEFQIPSNWAWTQLGRIALRIQYGYTASADPSATEVRMLRITDIQNNRVDWPSVPGCQIEADEAEKYLLSSNDILIARTGGTIGKSFIVPEAPVKSVFASYLIRVTPPQTIVARYLKTFLESPLYWTQLREMSAGTGQPNVNGQALGRLAIPIPPLAEQKRIVAKVDELMALCDWLEEQQQERETRHAALARASLSRFAEAPTPANLNFLFHPCYAIPPADLRKSILTLAVQGKLVSQDPHDEPVSKLVERLVSLTAECGKVPKPLQSIDTDALPFDLPHSWEWVQAQDLCRPSGLITYGVLKPVWVDVGVPTVRVQDMQGGIIVVDRIGQCAPERAAKFGKTRLEAGDLLIAKDGATLGKTAFVPPSLAGGNITQHVLRFPMTPHVDCVFIRLVVDSPHGQAWMRSETKGVALPGVNVGDFRRMPIPLPPLAEQRRIVAKVDQLMALVDQLESQLAASRATAANLLEALVAELSGGKPS